MLAGIFGMNLKSTLEDLDHRVLGVSVLIVAACVWVYIAIVRWTKCSSILWRTSEGSPGDEWVALDGV
jgi:magnesium transporter